MSSIFGAQPAGAYVFSLLAWSTVLMAWLGVIVCKIGVIRTMLSSTLGQWLFGLTALGAIVMPGGLAHHAKALLYTPSIALLLLASLNLHNCFMMLKHDKPQHEPLAKKWLHALLAVVALTLYPMALGLGPLDPYALGFSPSVHLAFSLICLLLTAKALYSRGPWVLLTIWFSAALAGFAFGLYESQNLWDCIIDPLAAFWAIGAVIMAAIETIRGKKLQKNQLAAPS